MPNPTDRDDVQHMPDDATPETDDKRKGRKQTGPRTLPQMEQMSGAPSPEERDVPIQKDKKSEE